MAKPYGVYSEIPAEEILPYIENLKQGEAFTISHPLATSPTGVFSVSMSRRYLLWLKSPDLSCSACGLRGTVVRLEYQKVDNPKKPHLNLYAIDSNGSYIMMTCDHIIPKSIYGPNALWNFQIMCCNCNLKKGNKIPKKFPANMPKEYKEYVWEQLQLDGTTLKLQLLERLLDYHHEEQECQI